MEYWTLTLNTKLEPHTALIVRHTSVLVHTRKYIPAYIRIRHRPRIINDTQAFSCMRLNHLLTAHYTLTPPPDPIDSDLVLWVL